VLERLQNEFLKPVNDRAFYIALNNNLLPLPPEALQGADIKVEYISNMAQMQKASTLTSIEQLRDYVLSVAQADPSALDKWDADESIDKYADALGTPPSLVISDEKVAQKRQAQQQQQQQQQAMQEAEQLAQGAKTLSDTKVNGNSALDQLMGMASEGAVQ
jgi:hypothetical protein